MLTNKLYIGLAIFVLLASSVACVLTGDALVKPDAPPEIDSEAAIATSVAATLEAAAGGEEALPPTAEPSATPESLGPMKATVEELGISFYLSPQLAQTAFSQVVPANEAEAPWWVAPEYRQISLTDYTLEGFLPPTIRVFSAAEFTQVNANVGQRLAELQAALASKPADGAGLAIPEIFNAGQMFQSNVRYLDFLNGSGARWLSQYGQALFPIGQPQLFYTFQGFTADGVYYVSIILPVNHTVLPAAEDVTLDDAFYNNFETYIAETRSILESQPDASFIPSLELLDQLVESITVGGQ